MAERKTTIGVDALDAGAWGRVRVPTEEEWRALCRIHTDLIVSRQPMAGHAIVPAVLFVAVWECLCSLRREVTGGERQGHEEPTGGPAPAAGE